jgi:hypothetical protein
MMSQRGAAANHEVSARRQEQLELALVHIREALCGIQYGTVHITVHEGVVVQIDRTEKRRLQGRGDVPPGSAASI